MDFSSLLAGDNLTFAVGTFLIHEVIWMWGNLIYLLCDRFGWCSQYRLVPILDRKALVREEWSIFWSLCWKHLLLVFPGLLLISPLVFRCGFTSLGAESSIDRRVVLALLWFMIVDETLFYWIHRALHLPFFYSRIHYLHHNNDSNIYSLLGEHSHILENFFNDIVPLFLGPLTWSSVFSLDFRVFWFWMAFRQIRSMDAHSNYQLPYHPLRLLSGIYDGPRQHLFHHTYAGRRSNYGGFNLWDRWMGTLALPKETQPQGKRRE